MPYLTKPCWETNDGVKSVEESCPVLSNDGKRICHLDGCGAKIQSLLQFYAPIIIMIPIGVIVAIFLGLIFILQITHDFRKDDRSGWRAKIFKKRK